MQRIVVNARSLLSPLTGAQRYTRELMSRWNGHADPIAPSEPLRGIQGHVWEQIVLPRRLKRRLLFSPSNSGPLDVSNQVLTIHDMVYFDHPETLNRAFTAWFRFLLPKLVRRVRKIISVSQFVKERIIANTKVDPQKIVVIPNGVGPRFRPDAIRDRDRAIAELKVPTSRYVLALGSIEPRKNLGRLLRAWSRIHSALPSDLWLVIAGAKGNPKIFRDNPIHAVPRVFYSGHVPDETLPALCAGALVMIYPSIYEGFGLPALEAMASGVPVIVGDCPALRESVADAGMFVDPYDENKIAEGLVTAIEDPHIRTQLRLKGLNRAKQFPWDKTARLTWEVLQQAADGAG